MTDDCRDEVRALFCQWPCTKHLGAKLKLIQVEVRPGVVETTIETGSMIAVLEEFIEIARRMAPPPRGMREMAARAAQMLPTLRAFNADPFTVMSSGVN